MPAGLLAALQAPTVTCVARGGFDVPDDFVLLLSGDDIGVKERIYRVVWRLGYEIGAKCVGHVRRAGIAAAG